MPGKRGLPFFGILPEAVLDPLAFARRMHSTYGPIHRFHACGNWNVQLVGPEANEFVLFDEARNFSAEGGWKPVFGRHFEGGLLLRDGADHQWHRKLVAAAFKQEQLQSYLGIFAAQQRVGAGALVGAVARRLRARPAAHVRQRLCGLSRPRSCAGRDARTCSPSAI